VPFLGAGANLCDRPEGIKWNGPPKQFLPSGAELAAYLARKLHEPELICVNPDCRSNFDLARISQDIVSFKGLGPLQERLHFVFKSEAPFTRIHEAVAGLGESLEPMYSEDRFPLVVTTNYDDMMERAYQAHGVSFDVVSYRASLSGESGGFYYEGKMIKHGNEDDRFCEKRPALLKIHGTIDRCARPEETTVVITEDHYIDYLVSSPVENFLPLSLRTKFKSHHFLFLGYSLRDWNLRVVLRKFTAPSRFRSWAVLRDPSEAEKKFWTLNSVDVIQMDLGEYMDRLATQLKKM
jgi:hypothetical protein